MARDIFPRCLFVACLTICLASSTNGQEQRTAPQQQTAPLPRPQEQPVLHPHIKTILEIWEKQGQKTNKLEANHSRFVYDYTFGVEKRAQGKVYYEGPDKGRIDIQPWKDDAGKVNPNGPQGKQYKIQADKEERWICDGVQIFAIDEERKEVATVVIPPEGRGQNIVNGPLPFLFGMTEEQAKKRYLLSLGPRHDPQKGVIHLVAKPLWRRDAENWKEAQVILSTETFLPQAIRLIHPGNTAETVYVFTDYKVNKSEPFGGIFGGGGPFKPNLRGYSVIRQNVGAVPPGQQSQSQGPTSRN